MGYRSVCLPIEKAPVNCFRETLLCTFIGHSNRVNAIKLNANEGDMNAENFCNTIASVGADKTVRIWDMRTRQCEIIWEGHSDEVTCLDWTGMS